ncbi:MAG TPA: hypothetical protein VM681_00030 [Candidatus Thermoplasmatota archaeon]|nr:hypothetical protein [Candidatus Thermoplasmatota archaeon]
MQPANGQATQAPESAIRAGAILVALHAALLLVAFQRVDVPALTTAAIAVAFGLPLLHRGFRQAGMMEPVRPYVGPPVYYQYYGPPPIQGPPPPKGGGAP